MNKNDHIRAVVFDLDGTLFDTLPSLAAAANDVLVRVGMREVGMPLLRPALSEGLMALFRKAIDSQPVAVEAETAARLEDDCMRHYTRHHLAGAPLYPEVTATLAALEAQGLALGICTNRDRASTDALLASAAIARYFDVIVGSDDVTLPKPAPEPLLLALERLGVPAPEVLFVGDSLLDARCAQLSRVRFAAHLGGYAVQVADLSPNVVTFGHYSRLTRWLFDHRTAVGAPIHA